MATCSKHTYPGMGAQILSPVMNEKFFSPLHHRRAMINAHLNDDWSIENVAQQLKKTWFDEDIRAHDGKSAGNHNRLRKRSFHIICAHFAEAKSDGDSDGFEYTKMLEQALVAAHQELDQLDEHIKSTALLAQEEHLGYDYGYNYDDEYDYGCNYYDGPDVND